MGPESANVQQLHVEDQRGTRRYGRRSARSTVPQICGDDELSPAADLHAGYTLVPTGNDLSRPQRKAEGLVAIAAAVELFTIRQPPGVVHRNGSIGHGLGTLTLGDVLIPQAGWSLRHGSGVHLERRGEARGRLPIAPVGWPAASESSDQQKEDAVQNDSDV